jgi:hypothetical protein
MDADVEICSLQNFGSSGGAKGCAQYRLPSFVTSARDSLGIILVTDAISENGIKSPHLNPLPASGARQEIAEHSSPLLARDARALPKVRETKTTLSIHFARSAFGLRARPRIAFLL